VNERGEMIMKRRESIAVWLIPVDGKFAGRVLLQQRAQTEMIDGAERPQSYPHICQPTWNEKVKDCERLMDAIRRGAVEELGVEFANSFDFSTLALFGIKDYSHGGVRFLGHNFIGLVTQEQLTLINLHSGAKPEFIGTGSEDILNLKSKNDPRSKPESQTVLFPDQYEILCGLFRMKEILAHLG